MNGLTLEHQCHCSLPAVRMIGKAATSPDVSLLILARQHHCTHAPTVNEACEIIRSTLKGQDHRPGTLKWSSIKKGEKLRS
jgi:hypothetical protein